MRLYKILADNFPLAVKAKHPLHLRKQQRRIRVPRMPLRKRISHLHLQTKMAKSPKAHRLQMLKVVSHLRTEKVDSKEHLHAGAVGDRAARLIWLRLLPR